MRAPHLGRAGDNQPSHRQGETGVSIHLPDMRDFLAWDGYCGSEGLHWEAADDAPVGFA